MSPEPRNTTLSIFSYISISCLFNNNLSHLELLDVCMILIKCVPLSFSGKHLPLIHLTMMSVSLSIFYTSTLKYLYKEINDKRTDWITTISPSQFSSIPKVTILIQCSPYLLQTFILNKKYVFGQICSSFYLQLNSNNVTVALEMSL